MTNQSDKLRDWKRAVQRFRQKHGDSLGFKAQLSHLRLLKKRYKKDGLTLEITCNACPEQYDVFCGTDKVAYLRLRSGRFTVEYPDVMGELIYHANPCGDGIFEDNERFFHMCRALRAIINRIDLIQ